MLVGKNEKTKHAYALVVAASLFKKLSLYPQLLGCCVNVAYSRMDDR